MKNIFTLLFFVFILNSARATNYYFSAASGDDSRTAIQAQNPSTPWKTLAKLNTYFASFQPGDSVLLNRGEIFYGSITVNKSGTASLPIVIGAYGTGNKPVITSLISVANWVSVGNGIYESAEPISGTAVKMVMLNGTQQEMGRFPNSDAPNKGFLTIESHVASTSFTDNELTSSTDWTGAVAVIRTRRWTLDRDSIISHSGTTITYKSSSLYGAQDRYGYFIENSIKTLDKFGEWYYNPSTKKLSVYFGSNNPSSYLVQVPAGDDLIHSESRSYITFDNLNITGSNTSSINVRYGTHLNITNCDINLSAQNGIKTFYNTYLLVDGCTITNSNYNGITMGYSGDNAIIRNNKIINTAIFPGMGGNGDQQGLGIFSYGNNNIIEYNEIRNVGFIGIHFNGNNVTVKNNYIDSFCFVKDDGGAIYSHIGNMVAPVGRKIIGNIITNGLGAPGGAYNPWGTSAEGVYLDNGCTYIEVSGNTIANCSDQGIFLHNSRDINITNNTVYSANNRYLAMTENANHPLIRNCIVSDNVFFKAIAAASFLSIKSDSTDQQQFATFSNNHYASPADNNITTALNSTRVYESTAAIKSFTAPVRFEYNRTQAAKTVTLDASYADARNNNYSGSITLQPFSSTVLIRTGSIPNVPPVVSITSPAVNATYGSAASINIAATASDADGKVTKVQFYNGTTLLATDTVSPYTYTWNNVAAGKYTITAKATDNNSVVTTSAAVAISVYTPNVAPSVSLISPTTATLAAPASLTVNATAADADGSISKVNFYSNDTLIGTAAASPYTFTWNNIPKGTYAITAKAIDDSSAVTTSAVSVISVYTPNVAPTVSISSPATAALAAPASLTITATAADTDGSIRKVDFYNNDTLIGTAAASPYTFTWNNIPKGTYAITAKATDDSSAVTTSAAAFISVYNPNVAPVVSITSPTVNATFAAPASVTITATAADTDGSISKVDFYNNDTLIGTAAASPYTFTWNNVQAGTYAITAKATDDSSAVTASAAVAISVYASNVAPTVSLTSPVVTTKYIGPATVTISAAANDADGTISSVKFYNGTTLLKTVLTTPYTYAMTNAAAGSYTITAQATDNKGLITVSAPVTITVQQNVAPSVSLTSPVVTTKYIGPATIKMSAAASDVDGTISSVKFYNGTTYLKTIFTSPYTYSMINMSAGTYTITAKATDDKGGVTISAPVTVTVLQNVAPSVSITSPLINATYNAPATINLSAQASDKDGSISKVDFYNGTALLVSKTIAPYTYSWQNVPAGVYTIVAKATDNKGAVTVSQSIVVSVIEPMILKPLQNNDTSGSLNNVHPINLRSKNVAPQDSAIYNVNVFPNPAVNKIQISISGLQISNQKANLSIANLSGIMVKNVPVILSGKAIEADVTSLSAGMYIVNIVSDHLTISKKFIKN